jgi:deoxyribodipyrimidine photolyase-like uncharacterized protein
VRADARGGKMWGTSCVRHHRQKLVQVLSAMRHSAEALRMEFFYREMWRETGWLMRGDREPDGGRWNVDPENRKALPLRSRCPITAAAVPSAPGSSCGRVPARSIICTGTS